MTTSTSQMKVRLVATRFEAEDVLSFVLAPVEPAALPPFEPGSHVEVHLTDKLTRSYSLSNGNVDAGSYRLTVQKDPKSRGGSTYMHDTLRTGTILQIGAPRNNFELNESAGLSVFIAGGIGITPFLPMMVRLNSLGKKWRVHYCVRTRSRAAFVDEIKALAEVGQGEVVLNFDQEPGGTMLDLNRLVAELPQDAHVYCCGPSGMLGAYKTATAGLQTERVHYEAFANEVSVAAEGGFVVELKKTGREVQVKSGQTILKALLDIGVNVEYSCEEGVCGACETKVISGIPDHRDAILSSSEKAANKTMMICCSGCKSDRLVLDL
ncbi:PDR/VanB family oxidoreductase [Noviherbaspirillum sedimenti]|uniref:Oxidoreductase n=1 Tax=Noviherbaspirillum sedimenti TaxID=2320865 RepID=A0A3A3G5L9_9BURK|nr:PDR/VanB family oxidoreductase [Noviherbaspirillum sedimenti]RJG03114.1 oxidoreductase [Noviherbaspirillum sedimenti]